MINDRIANLKQIMLEQPRYLSIEQAQIITETHKKYHYCKNPIARAWELREVLRKINIEIIPGELIVGNRAIGSKSGVVYPRSGLLWIEDEIETLPTRKQDPFEVNEEDILIYNEEILPYWKNKTTEFFINEQVGNINEQIESVVKVNQQGRSQGHIIPDFSTWLKKGPANLAEEAEEYLNKSQNDKKTFYESVLIAMQGAQEFILRYAKIALSLYEKTKENDYFLIYNVCNNLATYPPETFHEALQSVWFLLVILQIESNASSFSLGRFDQYLLPYYTHDIEKGILTEKSALELIECFNLKCNQIVCMYNKTEAQYFAGFPIGFNLMIGGRDERGNNLENELSFLMLKAQKDLQLPQPNLSARLSLVSSDSFIKECANVISQGGGLPQFFNDESIIPTLKGIGMSDLDTANYGVVGCVELSGCGNTLAWSNAAMFNLMKVLELTLNNGKCLITGKKTGLSLGYLEDFETFEDLESAFEKQIQYFIDLMIIVHETVDRVHQNQLATPFLSGVVNNCLSKGKDVTAGGAKYNFSGIQLVQVANVSDTLYVLKTLVFEKQLISKKSLMNQMKENWSDEIMQKWIINNSLHYGNDIDQVDDLSGKWIRKIHKYFDGRKNTRNGFYTLGLYTVSSHVPMGKNVGASCDGRKACEPLADGGISPQAGFDKKGPTSVLKSASKLPVNICANGTLLNMKFSKNMFISNTNLEKFIYLMRSFVDLDIHHVQFNVVDRNDLLEAKQKPEKYKNLLIRVAGYSAYFVELDDELQNEIISRTEHVL
ncbi:MAG: formate C-acetyltransferase/glycerol dehydratase family glycyl radical enzyme [Saccharofermentanales bacterium]